MLELDEVKTYLRVDYEDDDNLIKSLITLAQSYLVSAIDDFETKYALDDDFRSIADACMLSIINDRYNNRDAMKDDSVNIGMGYLMRSMITQLQYWGKANNAD